MPLFQYMCPSCENLIRRIRKASEANQLFDCEDCGKQVQRAATGPSLQAIERLDNGIMARPVERLADAQRIYRERADADTEKQKAKRERGTT